MVAPTRDAALPMSEERKTFGTVALDAPITRDDFERAVRYLHLNDIDLRDMLLRLAAQVVALTEALDRRNAEIGQEPLQPQVDDAVPGVLDRIRAADAKNTGRVW